MLNENYQGGYLCQIKLKNIFNENQSKHTILEAMPEVQLGDQQALTIFAARLRGELILPGNPEYETARVIWNGTYDHHPVLIVRSVDAEDVRLAVKFAYEQGMPLSVRSGGQSIAGYGTNDGGLVIDLSRMKAITVDPEKRTARLEPGLTWNEVAHTLQPYGLALSSGDTGTVGVGGLLLGGGIGWMVRKYGLTIDHVRAVELVTADGEFLRANADNDSELFWGLSGGGGNFGVVTAFEVDVHPAGMVLGGAVFYEMAEAEAFCGNIHATHRQRLMNSPQKNHSIYSSKG
jgi:FAD/FMN-containing dehydrogenase